MLSYLSHLSSLGRRKKIVIQILVDTSLVVVCFLAAMVIRLESFNFLTDLKIWPPVLISATLAITKLWFDGLYRALVRFVTGKVLVAILQGVATFSIALFITSNVLSAGIPRSVPVISGILLFLAISSLRFGARHLFRTPMQVAKKPVVIYGAGSAGLELLNSLFHGRDYAPIAFIDDDRQFHGLTISGYRVYPPSEIPRLGRDFRVEVVLLAMPKLSHSRRREIFASLEQTNLEIKTIPALSDVISGKAKLSELRNVSAEDLLGRDAIAPNEKMLKRDIEGKCVMVTGAGGSIGSELCRQILLQKPKTLILYDISEYALYSIEGELQNIRDQSDVSARIVPVMGSVQRASRLKSTIEEHAVETIYHAAAYKHVPLVEENIIEGVLNNVFGTFAVANAAHELGVGSFILVSTDKAVRPTNVMGATKRIAELICQSFAEKKTATIFSMVRFGNVLGSSGSVIPRFRKQIEEGGPITVTHREINRYFMTIPEAAQLVIQAGAMAKGGDVFVLDMGEAVRIADLAVTMVKLHGLTPYFVDSPAEIRHGVGDIPICFTGLRKGEKLYEELLIGSNPKATEHPRILTAEEVSMKPDELSLALDDLSRACQANDLSQVRRILLELPLQYAPSEP